jgi:hypothetical protein
MFRSATYCISASALSSVTKGGANFLTSRRTVSGLWIACAHKNSFISIVHRENECVKNNETGGGRTSS